MQEVTRHNGGFLLLWVIAIGLTGYALFRFSEAAFGVVGDAKGHEKGPAAEVAVPRRACTPSSPSTPSTCWRTPAAKSQAGQQQQLTTRVMQHSAGRWLVGIAGVVVIGVGLALMYEGIRRKFKKYFALADMPAGSRRIVWFLGTFGTTARGVVFALTGFFLVRAAWDYDPSKARGLDGALRRTVADSDLGRTLVGVVAVGLIAFGLYCYAEAAWRRT